jgi:hypothetical protein
VCNRPTFLVSRDDQWCRSNRAPQVLQTGDFRCDLLSRAVGNVPAGEKDATDMAIANQFPDNGDIIVADNEMTLDIDDFRATAREDPLARDPGFDILPNREHCGSRE